METRTEFCIESWIRSMSQQGLEADHTYPKAALSRILTVLCSAHNLASLDLHRGFVC